MRVASGHTGRRRPAHAALALALLRVAAAARAAARPSHPRPISRRRLAEAETFPYYRVYWVGPTFAGQPLAAADGLSGYINTVGDSVYYGDCVHGKGIFGGGSCLLPLQVTTVDLQPALERHASARSTTSLVRGVPATVYDEGRSIEVYSGRVAIDIFSDTFAHALAGRNELLPLNAPGSAAGQTCPRRCTARAWPGRQSARCSG